ncbi:protein of unknown function [Pseudobutyrivibrio sp. ACV-2]|uniref:ImmA/IrrE family metallo-endopeptidase n=1 Tax=Pseudobutyrivibrio sp. ACV-2 TaxID=1520801 RepID=UPI0008962DD7|nr:ImmA/IrrE family metallo-endopeptidase [Pseudobutyrivibrio sp. ACV-2]SEB01728.1 protein of unknown function [Pseudobutyrivibrio sp. ACV-2]
MHCTNYSLEELENKAIELIRKFDEERLYKTKPIDVYAVIEKCLGVPYDWKYLTPDQSILGVTAFSDGYLYVWPESRYYEGLLPYKVYVEKGTILIDETLTEKENRGRENFTVMHEIFHNVLHKECFIAEDSTIMHPTYSRTIDGKIKTSSGVWKTIEWQANVCAASFLMPADLVRAEYEERYSQAKFARHNRDYMWKLIKNMSSDFNVSKQAMSYRLQNLGLINEKEENLLK